MKKITIISMIVITVAFSGCDKKNTTISEDKDVETVMAETVVHSLKIGLMPAVDTAPIFLAEEKGYFDALGLDLEITLFTNAQNRQSALQSGAIDGAMTDLVAVAVNVAGGFDIRATMLTDGMFPLLAVPGAKEKNKLKVGMMEISVSNFLVDQWIGSDYEIEKVYINSIPARLEAVGSKQLDMGLFPEPIASVGVLKGLEKLIYEPVDGFSPDVMVFTSDAIQNKAKAIELFHKGYDSAIADIQKSSDSARDILIKSIPNLNPELRDHITLPVYYISRLPDDAYLKKIISWTDSIVEQKLDVSPRDLVDRSFVTQ